MSEKGKKVKVKTNDEMKEEYLHRLQETGVERALTKGQWRALEKITFLSANGQYGACFATKKYLANKLNIDPRSLYNHLKFLRDNGLIKVGTAPNPRSGDDCIWHLPDFEKCAEFAAEDERRRAEKRLERSARARDGRRAAAEREREEMRAELLQEMRAEVEALRAAAERERERLDVVRAQREREEHLRDALASEADGAKQERDRARAERDRARAERDREELAALDRMTSGEIIDRFRDAVSTERRVEILKWAYNQTVSKENRANGNFDPQPLIMQYQGTESALKGLLALRSSGAIDVN